VTAIKAGVFFLRWEQKNKNKNKTRNGGHSQLQMRHNQMRLLPKKKLRKSGKA